MNYLPLFRPLLSAFALSGGLLIRWLKNRLPNPSQPRPGAFLSMRASRSILHVLGCGWALISAAGAVVVTNDNDSGAGSLRDALEGIGAGQATTISFNIPGVGPHTIQALSPLPIVLAAVEIDGSSQPGYAGVPLIFIDGSQAGVEVVGLEIDFSDWTVRAIGMGNFDGTAITISGDRVLITGCYIGVDSDGQTATGNTNGIVLTGGGGSC